MAASINDLITKASNGVAPVATTLASQKNNGAATASLSLATGWPTSTAAHGLLYKVDANNKLVAGTVLLWKATLSGTTLSNFTVRGGTDDVYAAGSVIEMAPTSAMVDDLATALLVDHDTQGHHLDLHDANNNIWIKQTATASAVNYLKVANAIAGKGPTISPDGSDTNIDLNLLPKGTGVVKVDGSVPKSYFGLFDFVEPGGVVWTADAVGVTLLASMSAGFVWIGGKRLTVAAVVSRAFSASLDTYVYLTDNGDGTAAFTYTTNTTNAASPAPPANSVLIAIVVAGATNIATAASINQGQEDRVLPIASSIPYCFTESLGNIICPRDPARKMIGYRQVITNITGTTVSDITGLNLVFKSSAQRKVKVSGYIGGASSSAANNGARMILQDVTAGVQLANCSNATNASADIVSLNPFREYTPSATTINVKAQGDRGTNAATWNTNSTATNPSYIMVEQ